MSNRVCFAGLALVGMMIGTAAARAVAPPARADGREVSFEVRIVTLSDAGLKVARDHGLGGGLALLDEAELTAVLTAVQGDRRSSVLSAPRLQVAVGQQGMIAVGQTHKFVTGVEWVTIGGTETPRPKEEARDTGVRIDLTPRVGDDGGVRAAFRLDYSFLNPDVPETFPICWAVHPAEMGKPGEQPVVLTQYIQQPKYCSYKLNTKVDIPPGKTAVFSGWAYDREVKRDLYLSVLGHLPGVGPVLRVPQRLKQREHLVVLITPRVVQPEVAPAAE